LTPRETAVRAKGTHRLIRSLHPPRNIFADVSPAEDHDALTDLEGWTNDRIQNERGERVLLPRSEWATGANASIVMAAFCHPHLTGSRFTSSPLGGWYAAFDLGTAQKEVAFHWWREFAEVGATSGRVEARQYLADFNASFHDVRDRRRYRALYDPDSYTESQAFGTRLRDEHSNGLVYGSVRNPGRDCIVAFRPKLVRKVHQAAHFEFVWTGNSLPEIHRLTSKRGTMKT
jgi:hypothetical protein